MKTRVLAELDGNKIEVTTRYTDADALPALSPVSEKYTDEYTLTSDAGNVFKYDSLKEAVDAWNRVQSHVMLEIARQKLHDQKETDHLDAITSKFNDFANAYSKTINKKENQQ